MAKSDLTPKQEAACQAFVRGTDTDKPGSKSGAYRAAYNTQNMKPESINFKAFEFFDKVKIRLRVAELQEELRYVADVSTKRVLEELKCLSYADPGQLFDELKNGSVIPPYKLPEALRRAISGIDVTEKTDKRGVKTTTYKYKFWDKNKAIDMINKHVGLYELDNVQQRPVILQAPEVEKGGGKPATEDHGQE